jgi:glycosyltransferase involved in cell wall biosynthesis
MTIADDSAAGRLFVLAANVHRGGGRTLLDALLQAPLPQGATVYIDERMPLPEGLNAAVGIVRVRSSLAGRWRAERDLAAAVGTADTVLCFGNLPPLFRVAGRVVLFVQNRLLIDHVDLGPFPPGTRLRLMFERLWLRRRARTVDEFIVQTSSMQRTLERYLLRIGARPGRSVRVMPFMAAAAPHPMPPARGGDGTVYDFVYVSSGDAHKNHRRLVEAWIVLARGGHFPSLALTVDPAWFPDLCAWIEDRKREHGLRIDNKGALPHSDVCDLYRVSGALIFPSTLESFGLPMIEARNAGLAILAPELDYVRDILDPDQVFDPESAISIARAVKRHLRLDEPALQIVDAGTFVESLDPVRHRKPPRS